MGTWWQHVGELGTHWEHQISEIQQANPMIQLLKGNKGLHGAIVTWEMGVGQNFHARKWGCAQKVCIEGEQKVAKRLKRKRIMKDDKKTFKKIIRGILVSFQTCFGILYTFQPKKCPVGLLHHTYILLQSQSIPK